MLGRMAAIALCGNDGLDFSFGDVFANGVCVIAHAGEQRLGPLYEHPEQRGKTLCIVSLSGRQNEAKRSAPRVAAGMELGGEPAARSAMRLGRLSPLFMPTA